MDLFRTAGEDDSYAVADVFPIFAHSNLADSEPYLTSTRVGSFKKKIMYRPLTSRIEFFGPVGSWPGE
jgi:hypothetical protein